MSSFQITKKEQLLFRFKIGDKVWVRDFRLRGYAIVQAVVREQHFHPDRHPYYFGGEGYALDGQLWWDCYPGCRVFATREDAAATRLPKTFYEAVVIGNKQRKTAGGEHVPPRKKRTEAAVRSRVRP